MRQVARFRLLLRVIALFCPALLIAGCAIPSHEAALVARDLAAGDAPSQLKAETKPPTRHTVTFEEKSGRYRADLYIPADRADAAVLLIPGLAEEGKDDPRLIALARTLARVRFLVLVPELPSMRRQQIRPQNIDEVADAFRYLTSGRDFTAPEQAGIAAFSYAVGPVVIAASRGELARRVDFIVGVGGYYDLVKVLTFATTGYFRVGDEWRWREPNRYGKWVFVLGNLRHLPKATDRRALRRLTEWHLGGQTAPKPEVRLSKEAEAVYRLVTNNDPNRVPELIGQLPVGIRRVIRTLDPSRYDLSGLKARLILVHGRDDAIIPYTQSLALADAVHATQAEVFIVQGLFHVDVSPGFVGQWRLWRAVDLLLDQRGP